MGFLSEKDWNKTKNNLTWKLLEAGYTADDYPEGVMWCDYKYEFEYTTTFLRKTVLESPCGLLMKGDFWSGYMSYMGIDWRDENNNSVHRCPFNKVNCPKNHEYLQEAHCNIVQCAFHFSNKVYDYENSYEKAWDDFYTMQERKRKEFYGKLKWNPEARHCNCIRWDDVKQEWYARYDPWDCAHGCTEREMCILTGKRLDGKKGNVFYDVKITRIRHDGSLFDGEKMISIVKGKKMFDNPKPLAICEAFAKLCRHWILDREKSRFHQELFLNPDTTVEILNVRAEWRESRDLLQDLRDAQEGITITHASDLEKAAKTAKKERIKKRKEAKQKRNEKKTVANLKLIVNNGVDSEGKPASEALICWAKRELQRRGITAEKEFEQQSLF